MEALEPARAGGPARNARPEGPERGLTRRRFLLAAAALGAGGAGAAWFLRPGLRRAGPYLQDVRPDRVTVAAITPGGARLRLSWAAGGGAGGEVADREPMVIRGLVASGLVPATEYDYRLTDEAGRAWGQGSFRTAPAPGGPGRITFFALGDSGVTEHGGDDDPAEGGPATGGQGRGPQWQVAAAMQRLPRPDLLLHTGDLVYPRGAPEDWSSALFDPFAALLAEVPLYPTLGNHDLKTGAGAPYLERFFLPEGPGGSGRSYAFERGDALFVSFEVTAHDRPPDGPLDWLERTLRASSRAWKLVFFHVAPFSPCERGDSAALTGALVPRLARAGVDLVLCGHDHLYARYQPRDGVTYVTTGGGGGKLYAPGPDPRLACAARAHHFLAGALEGPRLELRAVGLDGAELDRVVLEKA